MLKCKDCKFWGVSRNDESAQCRVRSPVIARNDHHGIDNEGIWPWTDHTDWCGEAQPRVVVGKTLDELQSDSPAMRAIRNAVTCPLDTEPLP